MRLKKDEETGGYIVGPKLLIGILASIIVSLGTVINEITYYVADGKNGIGEDELKALKREIFSEYREHITEDKQRFWSIEQRMETHERWGKTLEHSISRVADQCESRGRINEDILARLRHVENKCDSIDKARTIQTYPLYPMRP